jgi:tetratricopeptide (TPR) repeat protein
VRLEVERAEDAERARRHDEARAHYERAIANAKEPKQIGFAHRELGEQLLHWGELEEGRQHLEASAAAVPGDPVTWQLLGFARFGLHDIPGAFAALEKSKALAPKVFLPRRDLAALHWKLGEGRDADPDPEVAAHHREAALREYREMLALDLPPRVREKVLWAIDLLSKPPKPPPFRVPPQPAPPPSS